MRERRVIQRIKHVGFTGSRNGMDTRQLRLVGSILVGHLIIDDYEVHFHHGDCVGSDEQAHRLARALRFTMHIHPPEIETYRSFCKRTKREPLIQPLSYAERNQDIVNQSQVLIAAPDRTREEGEATKGGTWMTVRKARDKGIPIYIAWSDGLLTVVGL
jgi:hypothetical protein